jgi:hypothetical protein
MNLAEGENPPYLLALKVVCNQGKLFNSKYDTNNSSRSCRTALWMLLSILHMLILKLKLPYLKIEANNITISFSSWGSRVKRTALNRQMCLKGKLQFLLLFHLIQLQFPHLWHGDEATYPKACSGELRDTVSQIPVGVCLYHKGVPKKRLYPLSYHIHEPFLLISISSRSMSAVFKDEFLFIAKIILSRASLICQP